MPKSIEALKAAHDRLTEAVESIVTGEDWQRMLKVASKFHRYSFSNQLLIFLQRPDATLVAGYRRWQELGRFVRKGEKGIAIFAPCKYKTKVEGEDDDEKTLHSGVDFGSSEVSGSSRQGRSSKRSERPTADGFQIRGFRVVHVFDISQTEGEKIEDFDAVRPKLLSGEAPEGVWAALVAQAKDAGFEVVRDQRGRENGYCDFGNKKISVRPDVDGAQAVKTLVHELAHAVLHGDDVVRSREIQEVEVESVAFIVLDALGMASDAYSFPYVARWAAGDAEKVKKTGERVVECSRAILDAVQSEMMSA